MKEKIDKILELWHKYFSDKDKQYSEFEPSDIEYFVGCMLYNHFTFTKALDNLKTMDLSYDFLSSCDDEYDEVVNIINEINFDDEVDSLSFLKNYIKESKVKYKKPELYLLDRLDYHVNAMSARYDKDINVQKIDFKNPLLKK